MMPLRKAVNVCGLPRPACQRLRVLDRLLERKRKAGSLTTSRRTHRQINVRRALDTLRACAFFGQQHVAACPQQTPHTRQGQRRWHSSTWRAAGSHATHALLRIIPRECAAYSAPASSSCPTSLRAPRISCSGSRCSTFGQHKDAVARCSAAGRRPHHDISHAAHWLSEQQQGRRLFQQLFVSGLHACAGWKGRSVKAV